MARPLDPSRLATVQLVPPTPFSADGRRVVPDVLSAFTRDMVAAGVRVFVPAAGTGEFHSLSVAEAVQCVRAVREAAGPECVVIAPVGFGPDHAAAGARQSFEAGADALLVMPPVHPYLCDAGFRDYFKAIAAVTPLPLLTYKRGPVPSDRLLLELAADGCLAGVKYAVNDLDAFTRFAAGAGGRLGLYCGTAERYAPFFMLAGATGYTSGAGCLVPRLTLALHAALAAGDYGAGMRLMSAIRPIEDARAGDGDSFNISLVKYGLELCGYAFGPPRLPQRQLTAGEKSAFEQLLRPILSADADLAAR